MIKNNKFSWDKTLKYIKKCNFQNFKIFMGSTQKKSIEKLTKLFVTKKVITLRFMARVILNKFKTFK